MHHVEKDYSKWLGSGYQTLQEDRVSTYVVNHLGYPDVPVLLYTLSGNCAFLAADFVE